MKKMMLLLCCLTLVFCLSACGEKEIEDDVQVVNPLTEISAEDMAKELGLAEISLDGASSFVKINGEPILYSMDVEKDGTVYDLRLTTAENGEEKDISGVYYTGEDVETTVFDSANAEEDPTVTVEGDAEYTTAYGCWNGYCFSVTAEGQIAPEEMFAAASGFVKTLLAAQ